MRDLAEAADALGDVATVFAEESFEADDCLATLAACGLEIGRRVILASPDKDLHQCLVEGQVTILKSFALRGGAAAELCWFTAADLKQNFGLVPSQWTEVQTLAGDATDGLSGAKGWGLDTAAAAIARWGSIEAMFANSLAVKMNKTQEASLLKLRRGGELALLRQLVTLRTDVPGAWDVLR